MKLLIVEDEVRMAHLLRRGLRRTGTGNLRFRRDLANNPLTTYA